MPRISDFNNLDGPSIVTVAVFTAVPSDENT